MWKWIDRVLSFIEEALEGDYKSNVVTYDYSIKTMITSNADKFVASAKKLLGQNLSEGTGVPYYVACAISVNKVHQDAFGFPIGGGASTAELYQALLKSKYFKQVDMATPGCIVISPTGTGSNSSYPHGHVGIRGLYGICSNDSATGIFSENYTDISWIEQFKVTEGYPVYFFARI